MKDIAKYRVGQMVYTYQSKETPARIILCKDVPYENYTYTYQMILEDGTTSNWTNEESVSEIPLSQVPELTPDELKAAQDNEADRIINKILSESEG